MTATDPMPVTTDDTRTLALVVAYEDGRLGSAEALYLFASLVRTGLVNDLGGAYTRTASLLVRAGWLSAEGEVNTSVAGLLCDHAGCRQVGVHHHCPAGPVGSTFADKVRQEGGPL